MRNFFLLLAISLLFFGCKEKANCENTACLFTLSSVYLTAKYADGSPVSLDSFKIIQKPGNTILNPAPTDTDLMNMQKRGSYLVVNDSKQSELENRKINVVFYGYKNGIELFNRQLTVGANCCNVQLYAGSNEVVLNK